MEANSILFFFQVKFSSHNLSLKRLTQFVIASAFEYLNTPK